MEKGNANLHFLDRYLGIPLIVFLGLFRIFKNKIPLDFKPKRIAILNISSIGDNILMSGPIHDLHLKYPDSEIHLYCGDTNYGVLKMIPYITSVNKLPLVNIRESIQLIRKQAAFDLMIDFGPWPRLNSLYAAFFRSACKIGFKSAGQWRHYVYDYAILHSGKKHEIDNFRALIAPLGISNFSLPVLKIQEFDSGLKTPYILFHPWPGGYKSFMKEWPKNNWLDLAENMASYGYPIYVTGAPADVSASIKMADESYGALESIAGRFNIEQTAGIIKNAFLLITVNTGIMHLGAAAGIKLIALNGPTSTKRWGAVSDKATSVSPLSDGCGYLHYGFEYNLSTLNCMELISVAEVLKAVNNQLQAE